MENIVFLYVFFTGCICTSWLYEKTNTFFDTVLNILCGFMAGWLATPILIGRAINKIYKIKVNICGMD